MRTKRIAKKNLLVRKKGAGLLERMRPVALIVLPVIVLVAGIYGASRAVKSLFHIEKVVFAGNDHLADDELRNIAGLRGNENLFSVSGRSVSEKMRESPWIREASVRKEYPSRLHILIKEAEPFALLDMKGRLFLIDEKGKMLEELKDSSIPFLPIISGVPFGKKELFSEALNLARAVKDKGLLQTKNHIEIIAQKQQDISVNLDGVVVKVGTGDYEDKLSRLADLEAEIMKRKIYVDYIDLRFANRAVVKPVNEVVR